MRIGVFGGTFDPVHLGHLILAEQCREQARLDRVLFVPAARPPHKQGQALARFDQRVEMLELGTSGNAPFEIDEIEKDRPGPSFTADTLRELHGRDPGAELSLVVGADSLRDLPSWYRPGEILELASLLVVPRPGWDIPPAEELQGRLGLQDPAAFRYQLIEAPLIHIASREIRGRVQAGRTIRYLVPRSVEAYIEDKGLYRADA